MTSQRFGIRWTSSALRSLDRLPGKFATACIEFVHGSLAENPQRLGHALRSELEGKHSVRRGALRVVYDIDELPREVTVLAIGARSDFYRPRC